jgi:small subunit ribosomal protein S17
MPKRVLTGTIVSDKGDKTVVVRVERRVKHPLYGKIIKLSKKYHAHDEGNAFKLGEQVRIQECAPVSKLKSWSVVERVGEAPAIVDEIKDVDLKPAPDVEPKAEKPAKKAPAKSKAKKAEPEAAEA